MRKINSSILVILVILLLAGLTTISGVLIFTDSKGRFPDATQIEPGRENTVDSQTSGKAVLVVGGDADYPPYSFLENGEAAGFDNDLIKAIARVMDVEIEFRLTSWAEAKQNLLTGEVDMIAGMAHSPARVDIYDFATPHSVHYSDIFVRKNSPIHSVEDIQGKEIIVQKGDIMEDYLLATGFSGKIITVANPDEALRLLAAGKHDGALVNTIIGFYYIDKDRISNLRSINAHLLERDYGFVVQKGNRELLQKLNESLAIVERNGVYRQISNQWFAVYQQESFLEQIKYYIYGLVAVLTTLGLVILWVWSLRRQVRSRTSALQESEHKYRQLINNVTVGIFVISDNKVVYLNPEVYEILGLSEAPLESINIKNIIHPFDYEMIVDKLKSFERENQTLSHFSFRIITSDGTTRWVMTDTVGILWEKKLAILGFVTDITEARQLDDSLKSSEEKYRLLFTKSPVGLFYFDQNLEVTNSNDQMEKIMHVDKGEIKKLDFKNLEDDRILPALRAIINHDEGFYEGAFSPVINGKKINLFVSLHTTPILNENNELQGGIGLIEDIAESVESERKIHNLEERFSKAFLTSPDAVNINRLRDGMYIDINRGFTEITGFTKKDVQGKTSVELDIWVDPEDRKRLVKELTKNGEVKNLEAEFRFKNKKIITGLMSATLMEFDGEPCIISITRDISERKRAEEVIRASEIRYRSIFESVPVSIWEQDFLQVYDMLEELRESGVNDLPVYLKENPEFVRKAVKTIKVVDVNEASVKIFKAKSKKDLIVSIDKMFDEDSFENFKQELQAIWDRKPIFYGETLNRTLSGERIIVNVLLKIPQKREDFSRVLVSISDITDRKNTENALIQSEFRYKNIFNTVPISIWEEDFSGVFDLLEELRADGITDLASYLVEHPKFVEKIVKTINVLDVNYASLKMFNAASKKELTTSIYKFFVDKSYDLFKQELMAIWEKRPIYEGETVNTTLDGREINMQLILRVPMTLEESKRVLISKRDITERKKAEEELRASERRYKTIFDSVPVSIWEEDFSPVIGLFEELKAKGVKDLDLYLEQNQDLLRKAADLVMIKDVNDVTLQMYGANSKTELMNSLTEVFTEESLQNFHQELVAFWDKKKSFKGETINNTLDGRKIDIALSTNIPSDSNDYSRVLVSIEDITERKIAEQKISRQVEHLAALRAVDMAISASMDLPIILRVLLNQVTQQLGVDSASILLLNPSTQYLEFAAGTGFKTNAIEKTNLRLGQSYAGRAALERRIIAASDLATKFSQLTTLDFDQDGFTDYIGIPLIAKGVVKGVLELFNRSPLPAEPDWMNLFESMAGQAAIAIDNATLFDEVQRVNTNLRMAYDATIEGWARALELRDGETEGHSSRVASLAMDLASRMGMRGEDLVNIRRGSLLHDIGKMGIPDEILLKPGRLTEKEAETMRKHPGYAKNLLGSVEFLQSAIEIPYSHHEKWDGSGYPLGLKGDEIPLSGRIFAVVDAWDALRSNRPYRRAWSDKDTWQFIEENSGKAYDPAIVSEFRKLLGFDNIL